MSSLSNESQPVGDGWSFHSDDWATWERRAHPHYLPEMCAAFSGLYPFVNDVEDARQMAKNPGDQQEVAFLVSLIMKRRYRIPDSPFDPDVIENEC